MASPLAASERTLSHERERAFRRERLELLPPRLARDLADAARQFGGWAAQATGLPVCYWDERFSSARADTLLQSLALSAKGRVVCQIGQFIWVLGKIEHQPRLVF